MQMVAGVSGRQMVLSQPEEFNSSDPSGLFNQPVFPSEKSGTLFKTSGRWDVDHVFPGIFGKLTPRKLVKLDRHSI